MYLSLIAALTDLTQYHKSSTRNQVSNISSPAIPKLRKLGRNYLRTKFRNPDFPYKEQKS